jgi:hypothetical protein
MPKGNPAGYLPKKSAKLPPSKSLPMTGGQAGMKQKVRKAAQGAVVRDDPLSSGQMIGAGLNAWRNSGATSSPMIAEGSGADPNSDTVNVGVSQTPGLKALRDGPRRTSELPRVPQRGASGAASPQGGFDGPNPYIAGAFDNVQRIMSRFGGGFNIMDWLNRNWRAG